MNKKLYYILITLAFGLISIPAIVNIAFQHRIISNFTNSAIAKTVLIFLICIMEASFIKKHISKIIGWVFSFVLLIAILFKIMHLPLASELIRVSGLAILTNLIIAAIIEKNKGLIHFLLFVFIFQRLLIILLTLNEILWWIDIIVCFAITLVGIGKVLNLKIGKAK